MECQNFFVIKFFPTTRPVRHEGFGWSGGVRGTVAVVNGIYICIYIQRREESSELREPSNQPTDRPNQPTPSFYSIPYLPFILLLQSSSLLLQSSSLSIQPSCNRGYRASIFLTIHSSLFAISRSLLFYMISIPVHSFSFSLTLTLFVHRFHSPFPQGVSSRCFLFYYFFFFLTHSRASKAIENETPARRIFFSVIAPRALNCY